MNVAEVTFYFTLLVFMGLGLVRRIEKKNKVKASRQIGYLIKIMETVQLSQTV